MSDATRAVALAEATKLAIHFEQGIKSEILDIAKAFDDFLNSVGETTPARTSTPGKEPSKQSTARKAPAKSEDEVVKAALEAQRQEAAAADAAADAELSEQTEFPPNKEGVQAVIAKMLQANKRKEAIALLKKFKAASATGVKPEQAADFIKEALEIVGGGVDLTA